MALSKTGLSDLIYENVNGTFKPPRKGRPSLRKLADALADAIVTHLKEEAVVSVSVTVADDLPGTGTGTGTGTGSLS